MQTVAAIPVLGLLIGCALGLLLPDVPLSAGFALLALSTSVALWAWQRRQALALAGAVGAAFLAGGVVLASDAWARAWRPPLRVVFEELARREREEAALAGRPLPEDDSASATLTGRLRADASVGPAGSVSLSLDVRDAGPIGSGPRLGARDSGKDSVVGDGSVRARGAVSPSLDGATPARGGVRLTVAGALAANRAGEWRAGRIVRMPTELRRPSRYLDPGVPDEESALARRGTTLVGTVKSAALVEVVEKGGWLPEHAAAARAFVRRTINTSVGRWSARSSAIVTAIVVGDRAGLDGELERRLQEAGTYHVIAISGGNIAILAGLTLIGFRVAGMLGPTAMLTAMAALLAYGYFVGGGASVRRATLMAVVYFGARAVDLRGAPANVLALAAGLLVAAEPLTVVDPGFLLTFGATAAILFTAPAVPLGSLPRPLAPLAAMLAASAAAESMLLPVSALLFARVTFAGLLANFVAIPMMAVAQIAGMALVPATAISPALGAAAGWIAHLGAEGLVRSADVVRIAPFLTWRVAPPSALAIAAYYGGLVTGWILWRRRARVATKARRHEEELPAAKAAEGGLGRAVRISSSVVALVAALWITFEPSTWWASRGDGRLHVTFLDVGQGDSAFVRFPRGSTLLVDTGGLSAASSFDIGDRVVAPVLRRAGVRRLDSLAVTHGDFDHAGGARSLIGEFRPRDVWEGIPVPPLQLMRDLKASASATSARWVNVQTGDLVTVDDVQIVARHPRPPDWERQDVRNDDSIVIELVWRDVSIVLTGDIGREVEREIAPLFAASPLRVLKVPHHGSLTSSSREFVRALAPRVAVVSVGRGNRFGHPAPDVVERYREVGAQIFRTDQDGAVTIDTDGYSLVVSTFTAQRVFIKPMTPRRG